VNGYLAKDGSNLANSTSVTVNGRKLFSGSSSENNDTNASQTGTVNP
jgi:hypothetical protein